VARRAGGVKAAGESAARAGEAVASARGGVEEEAAAAASMAAARRSWLLALAKWHGRRKGISGVARCGMLAAAIERRRRRG